MPFILLPLAKCVFLPILGFLSYWLSGSAHFALALAIPLFTLANPPRKGDGAIFKVAFERNALNRYVFTKCFAYLALAGSLFLITAPIHLVYLLLAGALGAVKKVKDPATHMVFGEILWLAGALAATPFISLPMMGFGISYTFKALTKLNRYVNPLCSFLLSKPCPQAEGILEGPDTSIDFLIALVVSLFIPVAVLIPLALLLAILSALRFPLADRHLTRLSAYCQSPNATLKKQLTPFITLKRERHHLIFVIRFFVRLFYPGKLVGAENLPPPDTKGVIYLCNHGYAAATIFSRAWLNTPFRSWSISDLMDPRDAYEHVMRYNVSQWKFIPSFAKDFTCKIVVRIFAWLFESIDSIPVYRHRLRELMKTFKATADAMECGDIVMIYPENPDDPSLPEPGYVADCIMPFFSGFTMIGSLFYNQTGRAVTYVPMYCSTGKRRLCVGEPIVFNPNNEDAAEKERIISLAYNNMVAMREETEKP